MANIRLRSIIIKLQDCLSNDDRERLHFLLGDDVPRRLQDNTTLSGTLSIMQSLFDRNKISEQDFTFLINVFEEIPCPHAVNLLAEYKQRIQTKLPNQPSQPPEMRPLHDQVFEDQEDKGVSQTLLKQTNNCSDYQKIITSNNTNINPVTINVQDKNSLSSKSKEIQPYFYNSFRINIHSLTIIILLILIFGTIILIYIIKMTDHNKSNSKLRYDYVLEEQKKNNETIQLLDESILEKNQQANDQLTLPNKNKYNSLVIEGREFGRAHGTHFDDSTHPYFTSSHYLNGILARDNDDDLESYLFYYSSSCDNQDMITSERHGNQNLSFKKDFQFDKNEKIQRVEGQYLNKTIVFSNGTNVTMPIITGLQFYTTKGHASPSYAGEEGVTFEEEYEGYTLWYVTGRSDEYIHQLQFYWYRTLDID
ncbi:unnamed protein product [Adineta steineri]|uniref:Uncharacterized protein n=1 Tax=Adineta steineri TaxID=433720 RepID=A0A819R807_9BILA|nr:unnamed protein product [Adineta steineri]CAF4047732.1 unnamed protein product [Adineta steineri]